ncbi:nitronate monooxygenase [Aquimarina sp. ERC-38]|uniref:NAD(P)H-dependent flavin oxidoreductase n=1 Tax=Aquimarina sp. ERC-38 TaxID=2949996 RepID=UPI0022471078|nr:nitronate monooxygenase [Aquimarina sp. ERC-38]UZO80470.1 nitronate monooxygenase [Aquimarina sp. ERC-38]
MNRITSLFQIKYPIVQGGMVWASGWKLASAVSNAGGLGLLGAGSMYPEILQEHIIKCKKATDKPFGVNVPMLYPDLNALFNIIIKEKIPIVFTSAGNPKTYTNYLKQRGIIVVHVVSNLKFALKSVEAGVDAIVVEGFEAGGHNGRDETTTLVLLSTIAGKVLIPVLAAGGIATGSAMYAVMSLGADGVQVGSRFVATPEASSHIRFKDEIIKAKEGDTQLTLKELAPVRLLKNKFYQEVQKLYQKGTTKEELLNLLGRARAKKGMYEGDIENGELEIGQVSGLIHELKPAGTIVAEMISEYKMTQKRMSSVKF